MSAEPRPNEQSAGARRLGPVAALIAMLVAVAVVVGTLTGGAVAGTESSQRADSLASQVRVLQGQVKALQARVADLEEYNDCEYVMPVGRYGDTSGDDEFGYIWVDSSWDEHLTSALDYVEPDEFNPSHDEWFVVADSTCVDPGSTRPVPRAATRATR
ncbi:MAG: hypothetical protein IT201_08950 [Thermoleophilia bacterium]|nr:hypothetical protein [Thermoleophilia bacterium]